MKSKNYIKLFEKWNDANNFVCFNSMPFTNESKKEQCRRELLSVKEFKNFNPENIKEEYETTVKSIKRFLVKSGIISKKNIDKYDYNALEYKKSAEYRYIQGRMTHVFY